MNHKLDLLNPYPFEKLNALLADVTPATNDRFIALSLGEPKHAAPDFLVEAYQNETTIRAGFGTYPPTRGIPELRSAIGGFIDRRFKLQTAIDPETQVLPVNGTREALFAFAQSVIDGKFGSTTIMPNPFYQIYEGAALLAGSQPVFVPCLQATGYNPDFSVVTDEEWERCELLYLCSPGNPTGAVMEIAAMQELIRLSDKYDFVIASDECYSEIYASEDQPPAGILEAAAAMGRDDFRNCIAFNSLSKRSNLPGLRSGYVAGDARIIEKFLLYRTYHGSAMSVHNQQLSVLAWQDEDHVIANRSLYREKYRAFRDTLAGTWDMEQPVASFYLWPETPTDDETFTRALLQQANIKVLPGSYLSRTVNGLNPGAGRVRMALVATVDECVEAATRLRDFIHAGQFA
ncbi:MAG: succinyldiaminopimelate transaminase [Pseudomonadales bacterium]|nr:succinyldiaminopimelate transaminase [Pseudomonadales bacterium]